MAIDHIVSVRVGDKYGQEYVPILHNMIARNLEDEARHWCVTDKPEDLPEGITAIPHDPSLPGWWQKINLFSPSMPWEDGERILYMDLDVAITGRLEGLPKGIIKDWHWPTYNSSIMSWDHGEHREVWMCFTPDEIDKPTRTLHGLLPKGQVNGGDQEYITEVTSWTTFKPGEFVSYRDAEAWPTEGARAVIFHGNPKPHEIEGGWVPNVWRIGGFTAVGETRGVNVEKDELYDNIALNSARDLDWFTGFGEQSKACVIVCGGPSMKDNIQAIKDHKRRGARIITVNNALRYLLDNKVKPDSHVMLDARPENVAFLDDAPKDVRYFLASQCHSNLFERLEGYNVILWHCGFDDGERMKEILKPWWDTRPVAFVPGGGTVGLRAIALAWLSGYRNIHVYGMDSSYQDGDHHAYSQPLNDGEMMQTAILGDKTYSCATWMVRQAMEFQKLYRHLEKEGVKIKMHGQGLIPDLWRSMR